ncbi:MAG: tetratricopeptide repeat protein [bacterium]
MINIAISFAIGLFVFYLTSFMGFPFFLNIIIAILLAVASFVICAKLILKKITVILEASQKEISKNRMDKAISLIKSGYKYKYYHPFISSQLNSQIGQIYYCKRDIKNAESYLKKGISTEYLPQCMLGFIYSRKGEFEKMNKTFKTTLRTNSKESFVWSTYAYCLDRAGKRDDAIALLNKAQKKLPGDEKVKKNLRALQNNQRIKMKAYKDLWTLLMQEKIVVKQRIRNPSRMRFQRIMQ